MRCSKLNRIENVRKRAESLGCGTCHRYIRHSDREFSSAPKSRLYRFIYKVKGIFRYGAFWKVTYSFTKSGDFGISEPQFSHVQPIVFRMGLTGGQPPPAKKFDRPAKFPGQFWAFPGKFPGKWKPGNFPGNLDGQPGKSPWNPHDFLASPSAFPGEFPG